MLTVFDVNLNDEQRAAWDFAVQVVNTLKAAGYQALWAGGCVRDLLLRRVPKDYDVACSATPEQVIQLFGKRRTVPVGASFGVVMVLGPGRAAGQIEVATFRADGQYLDGRRPESVRYCSPSEDAARRDFTINGMFFDPVDQQVIDYVGGREDLAAGLIRAIGNPLDRFSEDKLRMLRAVRFAAAFGFDLDPATAAAIRTLSSQLNQVSVERIAQEMRRMFGHLSRERSFRLLWEGRLLKPVFPAIFGSDEAPPPSDSGGPDKPAAHAAPAVYETLYRQLSQLQGDGYQPAFSVILRPLHQNGISSRDRVAGIRKQCRSLRLSGQETDDIAWLIDSHFRLSGAANLPPHILKPILADPRVEWLLDLMAAIARSSGALPVDADFCRRYLSGISKEQLNPDPLVTGQDLKNAGIPEGPEIRRIPTTIREEQLDEKILTRDDALQRMRELQLPT